MACATEGRTPYGQQRADVPAALTFGQAPRHFAPMPAIFSARELTAPVLNHIKQ
jgi:hypothetical protein